MAIRFRAPSQSQLRQLLEATASPELSYAPQGIVTGATPAGFRRDRWVRAIGHGRPAFDRASEALLDWRVHQRSGLHVVADGPARPGARVAMSAALLGLHVDLVCRVLSVIDEHDRRGFVYGTTRLHPESGEERFLVQLEADGSVTAEIVAVWKPQHPLARIAPIARRLQRRATERYLQALAAFAG